jgi:hypothetical protein
MTTATLNSMLVSLDIPVRTWTNDPKLLSISLENGGNYYHDYFSHLMYFDIDIDAVTADDDKKLLKIKYYKPALVSSPFHKYEKLSSKTFKIEPDIFGLYSIPLIKDFKQFRNPKIGDIVYTINASNALVASTTIESITGNTIVLVADLDVSNKRLCYASGIVLNTSLQKLNVNDRVESFLGNDSIRILKRPLTTYTVDEYISISNIEGFSLRRFGNISNFLYR